MSILSPKISNKEMGTTFHELKKQASFFFKEKIKSARLALTDVTPAELLTEEATNGNPWSPDTRTLGSISRAAFEVDDYWRIVEILHKRFSRFERKNWRIAYNSLILLEHLLTHGPESVAGEFQSDQAVIKEMESFQYIDENGFNWGLAVRKKSERVMKLLEKGPYYKEERERARKLTRGIQGFGSFCQRSASSAQGILQESTHGTFGRSHSQFNQRDPDENQMFFSDEGNLIQTGTVQKSIEDATRESRKKGGDMNSCDSFANVQVIEKPETSSKENMAPNREDLHRWNCTGDANPLFSVRREEHRIVDDGHPFSFAENQATTSLLSGRDGILQGC